MVKKGNRMKTKHAGDVVATGESTTEAPEAPAPDPFRDPQGLYAALEVGPDATPAEIRAAYQRMSKTHHPDKGGATGRFQKIAHAWAVLRDENARRRYDDHGTYEGPPGAVASAAKEALVMAMEQFLADSFVDVDRTDMVADMRRRLTAALRETRKAISNAAEQRKRILGVARRLRAPPGSPMTFHLAQKVAALGQAMQGVEVRASAISAAILLLAGIKYEIDQGAPAGDDAFIQRLFTHSVGSTTT